MDNCSAHFFRSFLLWSLIFISFTLQECHNSNSFAPIIFFFFLPVNLFIYFWSRVLPLVTHAYYLSSQSLSSSLSQPSLSFSHAIPYSSASSSSASFPSPASSPSSLFILEMSHLDREFCPEVYYKTRCVCSFHRPSLRLFSSLSLQKHIEWPLFDFGSRSSSVYFTVNFSTGVLPVPLPFYQHYHHQQTLSSILIIPLSFSHCNHVRCNMFVSITNVYVSLVCASSESAAAWWRVDFYVVLFVYLSLSCCHVTSSSSYCWVGLSAKVIFHHRSHKFV